MLSSTTLDDLIREQEKLRLQSLRNLEELRIRQDKYRRCRLSGNHLPDQLNVSRGPGTVNSPSSQHAVSSKEKKTSRNVDEVCQRPLDTPVRSSFFQRSDNLLNSGQAAAQPLLKLSDGQKHIHVQHSTSEVLADDLHSEKWSASATQAARKKLISGRTQTDVDLNNASSVESYDRSRVAQPPASMSGEFLVSDRHSKELDLHTDGDGYFSSGDMNNGKLQYNGTPVKLDQSLDGTPKSILRHRQIIDRNVHVESKFDHTPTVNARSRKSRRGLNFSYSDVDDAQLFGHRSKSVNFDVDSKKPSPQGNSHTVKLNVQPVDEDETELKSLASSFASEHLNYAADATDGKSSPTARKVASEGLLLQTGNDRQNANIVRELESRLPSSLFSSDQPSVTNPSANTLQSQVIKIASCSALKVVFSCGVWYIFKHLFSDEATSTGCKCLKYDYSSARFAEVLGSEIG